MQVVKKKNVNKIKNLLKTSINSENIKLNGVSFFFFFGEYTELQNKSTYIMIKENAINFIAPLKKL